MIIGVPKEVKNNENRVGLTPAGISELVNASNTVYIEKSVGLGSGYFNEDYIGVGASILADADSIFSHIVYEPIASAFNLPHQTLESVLN